MGLYDCSILAGEFSTLHQFEPQVGLMSYFSKIISKSVKATFRTVWR